MKSKLAEIITVTTTTTTTTYPPRLRQYKVFVKRAQCFIASLELHSASPNKGDQSVFYWSQWLLIIVSDNSLSLPVVIHWFHFKSFSIRRFESVSFSFFSFSSFLLQTWFLWSDWHQTSDRSNVSLQKVTPQSRSEGIWVNQLITPYTFFLFLSSTARPVW